MSLFYAVASVILAWILSVAISGVLEVWKVIAIAPLWLVVILVAGIVSWLISDP